MDVTSLIKSLDLSIVKMFFLRIFNASALYDYVVDKANTAANALLTANAETVTRIREKMRVINGYLIRFTDFIPRAWLPYAQATNGVLLELYEATEDGQIVSDEAKSLVTKVQIAYSVYKSED